MPDSPPPIGFHPNFLPNQIPAPPSSLSQQGYSAVHLSYAMPVPSPIYSHPQQLPELPPQPSNETHDDSSSSSSSSSSSNNDEKPNPIDNQQFTIADYAMYERFGYAWQYIGVGAPFPFDVAVRAGRDSDGSPIYAGRAFYNGDMLPAKVIPDKQLAYVSHGGEEIPMAEYEILRAGDFVWEFATNGEVPSGAVEAGQTVEGEKLYFGRCLHSGTQTPGKVQVSHGCLYIPFDGQEIAITEYEVLVVK